MAEVFWLDEAADQLDRIVAYIDIFDPIAAERMARRLVALGESLSDFPHRGRPARNGTREMTTVPPYILQYEVHGEIVYILGIRHGAQRLQD